MVYEILGLNLGPLEEQEALNLKALKFGLAEKCVVNKGTETENKGETIPK